MRQKVEESGVETYLDDLQQLLRPVNRTNGKTVQQLDCKRRENTISTHHYARMEERDVPISPPNRLNVLGILTAGLTSIKTPFAVWM
jgi:hypothetical protein